MLISLFIFTGNSFAAATGSEDNVPKYEKLYKKGALLIKQGKKLEKKNKVKKANKKYLKAIKRPTGVKIYTNGITEGLGPVLIEKEFDTFLFDYLVMPIYMGD